MAWAVSRVARRVSLTARSISSLVSWLRWVRALVLCQIMPPSGISTSTNPINTTCSRERGRTLVIVSSLAFSPVRQNSLSAPKNKTGQQAGSDYLDCGDSRQSDRSQTDGQDHRQRARGGQQRPFQLNTHANLLSANQCRITIDKTMLRHS